MLIVTDLTAQKHSEEIAAAERFARSILEQATDVVIVCDNDGRISKASWAAERLLERPLVGQLFADAVPVEVVEPNRIDVPGPAVTPDRIRQVALQGDALYGVEAQIRTDALRDRHFLLSAGPLHDNLGKGIGCILTLTDITERKRAEEHQTMLVAELNHRVKNILAVVQSVAWQTLATNQSLSGFKEAFDGRLKAISLAHDVLTQTRWRQVELERLLGAEPRALSRAWTRGARDLVRSTAAASVEGGGAARHGAARAVDQCGQVRRVFARHRPARARLAPVR